MGMPGRRAQLCAFRCEGVRQTAHRCAWTPTTRCGDSSPAFGILAPSTGQRWDRGTEPGQFSGISKRIQTIDCLFRGDLRIRRVALPVASRRKCHLGTDHEEVEVCREDRERVDGQIAPADLARHEMARIGARLDDGTAVDPWGIIR